MSGASKLDEGDRPPLYHSILTIKSLPKNEPRKRVGVSAAAGGIGRGLNGQS